MTKSQLLTAISDALSIIINKAKLLTSLSNIVNELFQTTLIDSDLTGTNKFQKYLRYKKIGNIVFIDGFYINKYSTSQSITLLSNIPDSVYYAKTGLANQTSYFGIAYSGAKDIIISGSEIQLVGVLGANEKLFINMHYQTND